MKIESYGKVWSFDDAPIRDMMKPGTHVEIEEKIDGSQFSCSVVDGALSMRSKGIEIHEGQGGMFALAMEQARRMADGSLLADGSIYRFEFLSKPKHNTLLYSRVPTGNLVLYDVQDKDGRYRKTSELREIASVIGVEPPKLFYEGDLPSRERIETMLESNSLLGGCKVEGVVIKARGLRHEQDGKMLKAKVVAGWFKERHGGEWKKNNPGAGDFVDELSTRLRTDARFEKAVQRLRESGELTGTVRDIGPLMKSLGTDMHEEQAEWIKEELFKHFWPKVQRKANRGFPDWYKAKLAEVPA